MIAVEIINKELLVNTYIFKNTCAQCCAFDPFSSKKSMRLKEEFRTQIESNLKSLLQTFKNHPECPVAVFV